MKEELIRKYASMLARVGLNIQKGQKVLVEACIEGYEFANIFAKEAYEAGAGEVIVNYLDQGLLKTKAKYLDGRKVAEIKPYEYEMYESNLKEGACTIRLEGVNPLQMEDASEEEANAIFSYIDNMRNIMRKSARERGCQWCIAMVPTYSWATLLFPDLDKEEALDKLWQLLLDFCYITENNDIAKVWEEKNQRKNIQARKLDELQIKSLHYKAKNGTDLTIELSKDSKFCFEHGDGIVFNANIPTEEISTSPLKTGVNGVVYSTRPLLLGGKKIENFGFRFENGKVVEIIADKGYQMLEALVNTDENAGYLGEVALVEYSSPISKSGLVFYTTLIDENASCHLALGRALGKPSPDFNDSSIHIDFMVGTSDLDIVATLIDGSQVQIFKNGDFAI